MNIQMKGQSRKLLTLALVCTLLVSGGFGNLSVLSAVAAPVQQAPSLPDQALLTQLNEDAAPSVVNVQAIPATPAASDQQPQPPFASPFPGAPFGLSQASHRGECAASGEVFGVGDQAGRICYTGAVG